MTDDATQERRSACLDDTRRNYLAAAGVFGVGLIGGGTGSSAVREPPSGDPAVPRTGAEGREDFLWLGGALWRDDGVRRNLYAFARRHDLAVVLVKGRSPGEADVGALGSAMAAASEFGLDVWLNVGLLNDVTAETFVAERDAREDHLEWLRTVAARHGDLFEDGRVILWQEAPVMGQWDEDGEWTTAAVENLRIHGPEIFAAQKGAIGDANEALDVGVFVHFPYIVDSKHPEVFRELVDGFEATGVEPDFGFVDFYRGWYEKDVGPEPANVAVDSLVTNVREALDDRPVFYLGQSHTINPNHTPSKQSLRMNLRTSLSAGAAGIGWYSRNRYVPTERGFDPFVPNLPGAEIHGDSVTTFTVARDRFLYPWLATLGTDGFDPDAAFDLWLAGDEFGHYDHRLSLRTAGGEWEYVGDFGGTADGDYPPDSAVTHRATIFRALDRERFLADGTLEYRIETRAGATGTTLRAALAMPCEPTAYVSEAEAAAFVHGSRSLDSFRLGGSTDAVRLRPGEARSVTVPVTDDATATLHRLRHPDSFATLRGLASLEARDDVDPGARFDLWVSGEGIDQSSSPATDAIPALVDHEGDARAPETESIVASTNGLVVCYGLERDRYLDGGELTLAGEPPASAEGCYAMPYAGSACFRPPAAAAELLETQPDEVATFSVDVVRLS